LHYASNPEVIYARTLRPQTLNDQRRRILERLAAAQSREKRGRRIVVFVCAGCFAILAMFYVATTHELLKTAQWPPWLGTLAALSIILSPVTALLVGLVYLLRHRRELALARREAREQASLELPRQLTQLRQELEELRQQLPRKPEPAPAPRPESGFSLTELLVVVAIMTILTSLSLAALSGAKSRARITTCQNNLRQIGCALSMYETDCGYFPGPGDDVLVTNQVPWILPSPAS
jgi:prepilin-type N-terminal cleavage/methylation domain-containing protein